VFLSINGGTFVDIAGILLVLATTGFLVLEDAAVTL
jgi:hypothetical protein